MSVILIITVTYQETANLTNMSSSFFRGYSWEGMNQLVHRIRLDTSLDRSNENQMIISVYIARLEKSDSSTR